MHIKHCNAEIPRHLLIVVLLRMNQSKKERNEANDAADNPGRASNTSSRLSPDAPTKLIDEAIFTGDSKQILRLHKSRAIMGSRM